MSRLILLAMLWAVLPLPQGGGKQPEKSREITRYNKPERDPYNGGIARPERKPRPEKESPPERQPDRRKSIPGKREPHPCVDPDINPKRKY